MNVEAPTYRLYDGERYYVSEEGCASRKLEDAKVFKSIEEIVTTATIYNDWQEYEIFMRDANGVKKVPETEWGSMYRARRDKEIAKILNK